MSASLCRMSVKCDHISILHSTGPRPDWDPDVVATPNDDYDHCYSLRDDFVGVANAADRDEPHPSHQ